MENNCILKFNIRLFARVYTDITLTIYERTCAKILKQMLLECFSAILPTVTIFRKIRQTPGKGQLFVTERTSNFQNNSLATTKLNVTIILGKKLRTSAEYSFEILQGN